MKFRKDRRGFIFSLDAAFAMLVVLIVMAGVARVSSPESIYGGHGYLRLERYANDALEVMQLTGTLDNVVNSLSEGESSWAESLAENELRKILPNEIQFRLLIGDESDFRLDNVYPSVGNHDAWYNNFLNAKEIAVATRVSVSHYWLDQNNPNQYKGYETDDIIDETWQGQTFVAGRTGALVDVSLKLNKEGNPGELTIEIRDCAGANDPPGSTVLASTTTSAVTSETGQEYKFAFASPASVTAGTYYAIVLHEPDDVGGDDDKYQWAEDLDDPYSEGYEWRSTNSGGSWSGPQGGGWHDFWFRTYVEAAPPENIFDPITLYVWRGPGI